MVKIYVLDTNVLIQAPYAAECFEDNQVVLLSLIHISRFTVCV